MLSWHIVDPFVRLVDPLSGLEDPPETTYICAKKHALQPRVTLSFEH